MKCRWCGTEYGTKVLKENGMVTVVTDQPLCECEAENDQDSTDELAGRPPSRGGD